MKSRHFHLGKWLLSGVFAISPVLAAPLHDASRSGNLNQVKRLISRGADVNAEDRYGLTPLLLATDRGHTRVITVLKRKGAKTVISSASMAKIQTFLQALDYEPGAIDGLLGPGTRDAIRAYQKQIGLQPDGRIAEDWIVQLHKDMLKQIQLQLQALGYDPGDIDGLMGPGTRTAIRAFQEKEGLPITNEISEDWFNRLLEKSVTTANGQSQEAPSTAATEATETPAQTSGTGATAVAQNTPQPPQKTTEQTRASAQTAPATVPTLSAKQPSPDELRNIQNRLKSLGYFTGEPDGLNGKETEAAIRAFQEKAQLPVTGQASQDWLLKLDYEVLRKTRDQLKDLGYGTDEISVELGTGIETRIRTFQEREGLPATGRIGADWAEQIAAKAAEKAAAQAQKQRIMMAQRMLQILGYTPGNNTGELDADTQSALRTFQKNRDLPPNKEISEALLAVLDSEVLHHIQTRLKILAYELAVSGQMDEKTRSAILAFQQKSGLPASEDIATEWISTLDAETLRYIQNRLKIIGFDPGSVDGRMNQNTRSALQAYRQKAGLPATDEIDAEWVARLDEDAVRHIQNRLLVLGHDPGEFDGRLGAGTRAAIRVFQEQTGLPVTGEIAADWAIQMDVAILRSVQARLQALGYREEKTDDEGSTSDSPVPLQKPQEPAQSIPDESQTSEPEARLEATEKSAAVQTAPSPLVALLRQQDQQENPDAELVSTLQSRLQELDYYPGAIDGLLGPGTTEAIRAFQRKTGLSVTGEISEDWLIRLESERLRAVQNHLTELGYKPGPGDGEMGTRTRAAIRDFEKQTGLTATGEISDQLVEQLQRSIKQKAASQTASSEQLQQIQGRLQALGYDPGPVDGELGPSTQQAIRAFQKQNKLKTDGKPSSQLITHLDTEIIRNTQARLRLLGYKPGPVDGELGRSTQKAIRAFQRQAGLTVSGAASATLVTKLTETLAKRAIAQAEQKRLAAKERARRQQARRRRLADIQTQLQVLDYDIGTVDGEMGARTQGAIRSFQRQTGLTVDGEASEELLSKLEQTVAERQARAVAARAEAERRVQAAATQAETERQAQAAATQAETERQTQTAAVQLETPKQPQEVAIKQAQPPIQQAALKTPSRTLAPQLIANTQSHLKALGYNLDEINGKLGEQTQSAIRAFQTRAGLPVTGEPSQALVAMLEKTFTAQAQANVAKDIQKKQARAAISKGKIIQLQRHLKTLGHDPGRLDGELGERTQGAIRAFQAQAGLPVTGTASRELYATVSELAASRSKAAKVLNRSTQSAEINGAMLFQRSSNGELIGCSVQNVQLDVSWCNTFVSRRSTTNCKVVLRSNAEVLYVKCV